MRIPQMVPWFDKSESQEVARYLESGGFLTEFRLTSELELEICNFTGAQNAIMTSSGTTALLTILYACGIGPGDEVVVPNYTMIATANAVRAVGAKPVFVDVHRSTLTIDLELVRQAITDRTRAIIVVLANGREPVEGIGAFEQLCGERNLLLIEDSAQALGCYYRDGRAMGTVGIAGALSFSVPKIVTTGQGGAVLTASEGFADEVRSIKDFGRREGGTDVHPRFGLNFKFTDLQAAVGLAQMRKLNVRMQLKKEMYARYCEAFERVPGIHLFTQDLDRTTPWFMDIAVDNRDGLVAHLSRRGIGTRPMYPPINRQEAYGLDETLPISTWVGACGLWLPSSSQITLEDIAEVINSVTDFVALDRT